MSKDTIRSALLKSREIYKEVEFQGTVVALKAPTMGAILAAEGKATEIGSMSLIIECIRDPETHEKIFSMKDLEALKEQPCFASENAFLFLVGAIHEVIKKQEAAVLEAQKK